MKKFKLYENDLSAPNLRDNGEETTEEVVARWFDEDVYYEAEDLSACEGSKAVDQYYSITAERILLRKKVLGLCNDDEIASSEKLLESHPFLGSDLTLGTLLSPEINVAMALVPLTPLDDKPGRAPELARLYCVTGALGQNDIPFESEFPIGADSFRWFLCGCDKTAKPAGESWHLAAHLLMRVVEDVHRKKNLAIHFVVTGRVQFDEIKPVEMGRKSELADIWEFKDLKWIMHKDNKMNMNNAMRKVETPKTLEEALELIETLQNKATRSFFRFLRDGNLAGVKEQFEIGADIFACEEATGQMPLEILGELIEKEAMKPSDNESGKTCLMRFIEMMTWLKAQGADCALMFYMLAKYGLDDALQSCLKIWPIEARSASGLNATGLALENGDYDVALKLCALGCKCRLKARNSFLANAVTSYCKSEKSKQLVEHVLSVVLSPDDVQVSVKYMSADDVPKTETLMTTLWGAAVYYGDVELMRKCLEHGASVTAKLHFAHAGEDKVVDLQYLDGCSPIEVILMSEDIPLTQQNGAFDLLKEYGLKDSDCPGELLATRHSAELAKLVGIEAVKEECVIAMGVSDCSPPRTTDELGAAVWYMWIDVLERCLSLGASAGNVIHYYDEYGLEVMYGTPRQIIDRRESCPAWQKNRALKLLAKYANRYGLTDCAV